MWLCVVFSVTGFQWVSLSHYAFILFCFFCGQDYATALDLMQELILTTDVAEHLKVIKEIEQMVEGLFTHVLLYVLKFDRIGYIDSAI